MRPEGAGDHEVGSHGIGEQETNRIGMLRPDLVEELNAGERAGFEIDKNKVESDLAEPAKGVFSGLADMDFPTLRKFGEKGFHLGESSQVIDQYQNSPEIFHAVQTPATAGSNFWLS